MKRIAAIVVTILMLACSIVVPASAATPAQTKFSAKKGDEVIYSLNLTVPQKVVGCDLSVYYDSKALKATASADFTGSYNVDDQQAVLNHDRAGEALCVFSIFPSGVDCKKEKTIFSVKFTALKDIKDTHITYYVRYLYPVDKNSSEIKQFKDYKITCDLTVNGKKIADSKAPELNTTDSQTQGEFINSVSGDGKDADVNMADVKKPENNNNNNNDNNNNVNNDKNNNKTDKIDKPDKTQPVDNNKNNTNDKTQKEDPTKTDKVEKETTASDIGGSEKPSKAETSTKDQKEDSAKDTSSKSIFASPWFWIAVALVIAVAGTVMFIIIIKKNK